MSSDVLCLSHLRWDFVYQRPNHLMSRCARDRRVYFVEEPVFDAVTPRLDVGRVGPSLYVVVPRLPARQPPSVTDALQRKLLEDLIARADIVDPWLWFYTPMAMGFSRELHASAIVYDCMDELSHFRGAPVALQARERELFDVADLVFTGGQSLFEAKRAQHPSVHAFPSSVDASHFMSARYGSATPGDQRSMGHPRLGFFGVVDERMNMDLVEGLARARPDYKIVIVGPVVKIDPAALPRLPNLHWLGPKPYEELPSYIAGWDVAIMPFALNDATKFISPTKTLEYLAAGKPVVSTSIRDVVDPYGEAGLVRIADDVPSFIEAVDDLVAHRGTRAEVERQRKCDALLAETSWDRTWQQMRKLVEAAEMARAPSHVARWPLDDEGAPCSTV